MKQEFAYQGIKKKKKNYFEGWYYKNVTVDKKWTISIIPGISYSKEKDCAFIQVIESINHKSYYIEYDIDDVVIHQNPVGIQIKNNYFYEDYIDLDIHTAELELTGFLYYSEQTKLKKTAYAPTIMGPFSYLPMECYHSIISMHHYIDGVLSLNQTEIDFEDGIGYIEKDYGTSFPKEYTWIQTNTLEKDNLNYKKVSLFFSVAEIPTYFGHFNGFIAVFYLNNKEYRFTTYNGSKLIRITKNNGIYKYVLKSGNKKLLIRIKPRNGLKLRSPKLGVMDDTVLESLDSVCHVTLYQKKKVLFQQKMRNTGYKKKEKPSK